MHMDDALLRHPDEFLHRVPRREPVEAIDEEPDIGPTDLVDHLQELVHTVDELLP